MTDRLYLSDPDLLEFDAEVVAERMLGDRVAVVLSRTAFYPEGGGQPADRGMLGAARVVDVQEVDGEVRHAIEGPPPAGRVRGVVDGARRRDHLQQHHGQHLLSAAFEARLGARTLSFHLGEEICTIDLDVPPARLGPAALRDVEAAANDLVFRDLPVTARDFAPEELTALPLRKEPMKGNRVVVVGEPGAIVDASPCGGTHPRRTGAVGAIAVLRASKWGAGSRVEFVCGGRVVRLLALAQERIGAAAGVLRCAPAELPASVEKLAAEASARRKEVERLAAALADAEAERLAAGAAGPAPIAAIVAPPASSAPAYLKALASALAARGRIALLAAIEDGRAHLCFARPKGPGPHMGERVKEAAARLQGKGGGAPDLAQGSGPVTAALEAALAEARRAVSAGA